MLFRTKIPFYITLQGKRLGRKISEAGIHPILGVSIFIALFIILSYSLFLKIPYAQWIYMTLGILVIQNLSSEKRNEFIRSMFNTNEYRLIRAFENIVLTVPFIAFLSIDSQYFASAIFLLTSLLLAITEFKQSRMIVIPTPFRKLPFEFIVGFRKNILLYIVLCILFASSLLASNANLSLLILGFIFLSFSGFYTNPEVEYFVWIYSRDPSSFLVKKILNALFCSSIITLPFALIFWLIFPEKLDGILFTQLLGYVFLSFLVITKYSAFPHQIQIPQGLLFCLAVIFPPSLVFIGPIFYLQAIKRLKIILH